MVEKEKNNKLTLEKDGQTIEGDDNLLQHATKYYVDLFGPTSEHEIQMDEETQENIPNVSEMDNSLLCRPFSEKEVKEALWQLEKNKAIGPDKIPIEFYNIVGKL